MKKKIAATLAVTLFLTAAPSLLAQQTVSDILGIEVGTVFGYNFAADEIGAAQSIAISFGFAERFEAAMVFIDGGPFFPDFSLTRLSYYVLDEVGLRVSTGGSDLGVAVGFGLFSYPIRRRFNDTLTTALGLVLDYLVPDTGGAVEDGVFAVGLNATIAF